MTSTGSTITGRNSEVLRSKTGINTTGLKTKTPKVVAKKEELHPFGDYVEDASASTLLGQITVPALLTDIDATFDQLDPHSTTTINDFKGDESLLEDDSTQLIQSKVLEAEILGILEDDNQI